MMSILQDEHVVRFNCFFPADTSNYPEYVRMDNLFIEPELDKYMYLQKSSPCLYGGENGTQIGALGTGPESRPVLKP